MDVREEVLGGCSGREEERRLEHSFVLMVFRGGIRDSLVLDFNGELEGARRKKMSPIFFSGACPGTVESLSSSESGGSLDSFVRGGDTVQLGGNQKDLKNVCTTR